MDVRVQALTSRHAFESNEVPLAIERRAAAGTRREGARDAAVVDGEPEGVDGAGDQPRRLAVEIDAERAHDDGPAFGNGVQTLDDLGQRRAGEGAIQEEDRAVVEIGCACIRERETNV